jgi:hypothetical protein
MTMPRYAFVSSVDGCWNDSDKADTSTLQEPLVGDILGLMSVIVDGAYAVL